MQGVSQSNTQRDTHEQAMRWSIHRMTTLEQQMDITGPINPINNTINTIPFTITINITITFAKRESKLGFAMSGGWWVVGGGEVMTGSTADTVVITYTCTTRQDRSRRHQIVSLHIKDKHKETKVKHQQQPNTRIKKY